MSLDVRRQYAVDAIWRATDPMLDAARRETAKKEVARLISVVATCDVVYECILQRCVDEPVTTQHDVLLLVIALLHHSLCVQGPSPDTLYRIKVFVDAQKGNERLRRFGPIRAGLETLTALVEVAAQQLLPRDRLRWVSWLSKLQKSEPHVSVAAAPTENPTAESGTAIGGGGGADGAVSPVQGPVPMQSMIGVGFVGAHLRGVDRPGKREATVDIRLPSSDKRCLAVVAKHKSSDRIAPPVPNFPVHQFRYYCLQQPSKITSATFAATINTLHSVFDYSSNPDAILAATATFIKVVCDMYARRLKVVTLLRESSVCLQSVLIELLSSNYICVRRHVFEIIFNLCVHINVLEELSSTVIAVVHNDLVTICQELLLMLYLRSEDDDGLWLTALRCLLAISSDPSSVDVRVLRQFIHATRHDYKVQHHIIGLLLSALTTTSNVEEGAVAPDKLEALGGVSYLVTLYASVGSHSLRQRIMGLLICIAVQRQVIKEKTSLGSPSRFGDPAAVTKILTQLRKCDFSWYMHTIFVFLPASCSRDILTYMTGLGKELFQQRHVLLGVVSELVDMAQHHHSMAGPLQAEFRATLSSASRLAESQEHVLRMTVSESQEVRSQAEKWIFCLVKNLLENGSPDICLVASEEPNSNSAFDNVLLENVISMKDYISIVHKTMQTLAESSMPCVRKMFLSVTHKVLLWLKSSQGVSEGESRYIWERMHRIINTHYAFYAKHSKVENDPEVLLYLLEILLTSVGYLDTQQRQPGVPGHDSFVDLFLQGSFKVPLHMLHSIRPTVIMYVLQSVSACVKRYLVKPNASADSARSLQVVRYAVLMLLLSHPDSLSKVDASFWRSLMADPYPAVATAAAAGFLRRVAHEDKAKYQEIREALIKENGGAGAPARWDNPYLHAQDVAAKMGLSQLLGSSRREEEKTNFKNA